MDVDSEPLGRSWTANTLLAFVGTASFAAGQWALVIVLARFASTDVVGQFALAMAITTPLLMFASLSLRTVLVADPMAAVNMEIYLAVRLTLLAGAMVIVCLAAWFRPSLGVIFVAVFASKSLDALADIYFGLHQHGNDLRPMAGSQIVNGVGTPVAVGGLLVLGASPASALWGSVAVSAIAMYLPVAAARRKQMSGVYQSSKLRPTFEPRRMLKLIWLGAPLGVASCITALAANLPRYALGWGRSSTELGIFAAISYMTLVGLIIVSALAQAALPRLVNLARNDSKALHRRAVVLSCWVLVATIPACLAAYAFGDDLLRRVYGEPYALAAPFAVLVFTFGALAASWVIDTVMAASQLFYAQMQASVMTLLAGAPVAFWLSVREGILGAAIASAIIAVAQLLARLTLMSRTVQPRQRSSSLWR